MDNNKPICKVDDGGTKFWYLNGKLHREDGPAVEYINGSKYWYLNGQRHRVDGPAVEWPNGSKSWWLNSHRHREDGPAYEDINGYKEWRLNNIRYNFQDYIKKLKEMGKSNEDIMLMALKYG
jgi:hypothetical protein